MDFITNLPPVCGYNSILVVVDQMSKYTICILTSKDITCGEVKLDIKDLTKSHHEAGDEDRTTIGGDMLWKTVLRENVDEEEPSKSLRRYHPEADGQTKHMNQTLEQYLHVYCIYQQDNWDELLPLAKIALNSAENTSTGVSPYFANKGYHPHFTFSKDVDVASAPAHDFAVTLESLLEFLQAQLLNAQETMKKTAD